MQRFLTVIFLAAMALLLARGTMFAADTLVVYASGSPLDQVILKDTAGNGAKLHHTYMLVSRDTTYLFDGTITTNENLTILGVPDPVTGKLPCIQPDVLSGGAVPGLLFTLNGPSTQGVFKNLYLLGIAINNTVNYGSGQAIQVSADNIRLVADNVVFEQWSQFAIGYSGNWDKFYITNCKFRNMTTLPNQWYVGELLRNENYLGQFPTDTVVIRYCTMLGVSGYATAATGGIVNYYEFNHNNVVTTFKNPFFLDRMVNARFINNIFYNAFAGGQTHTEYGGWDSFTPNTGPSIITMGPLDSTTAALLLGHSITTQADTIAAERARKVEVKNNAYFWSSGLTNFWNTEWNDTAHVDSIYTPTWMNASTAAMFANPTKWPGFSQSGNLNVDPGFGASIPGMLNAAGGNGVGLLNWFVAVRKGTGTTETYGYKLTQVSGLANWTPPWPLPEKTDMAYTNTTLLAGGTDGMPVGDPNWITGVQSGTDTLVVYANGAPLDQVILGDTVSGGAKRHHTYKLVSRDTTYLFDGTITTNENLTILGVPDPVTGKLPCIQPDVLSGGAVPGLLFTLNGPSTQGVFKNLYLLGIAINNTVNYGSGQAIQVSADNIRLVADNCVFEQWSQFAIGYSGRWDKFYITNCKFRNMTTLPNQWYVGELLRNENYLGQFPTDTVVIRYCTMLGVSGYATAATGGIVIYYEFNHNSVVTTFKNPFFLDRMVNAKFINNIFYNAFAGGQTHTEYGGWDSFTPNTGPSIITMGPLDSMTAALHLGRSITSSSDSAAAEAARNVEVKNNAYFWSSGLTTFWNTEWNDTAHVDSIYTPTWMNASTAAMFANPARWPGFVESGNQNADPGFGASIPGMLNAAGGNGVGLLNWFVAVRKGSGTTETYGYKLTQVSGLANWTPPWPLPEMTDMAYSNTAVKNSATDALPLGDPYWFTGVPTGVKDKPRGVPSKFTLSPAYPNPFNPATNVQYTLSRSGIVSLKIYNILGQLVKTVVDNVNQAPSSYTVRIDMAGFNSGVYFYVLQQGNDRLTRKMMLLK